MIYYLMFFVAGILIDYKDLKNSDMKTDIIFYVIAMTIAFCIGIFYYSDPNRIGMAEYIIKLFGLGGM